MIHIDLFSGIGGFALAIDNIFHETSIEHIFCENDPFCRAVLQKNWPHRIIIEDIRAFTSYPISVGRVHGKSEKLATESELEALGKSKPSLHAPFILTGGFPCQPFSQAGRRKGTSDDRHLWPEMLRVIRFTKPEWVVAENVRGLLTIGEGMVFEQVCADLEGAGYEVQPIVIPAVAVNAPHRRDRVWFVAHRKGVRKGQSKRRNDKRLMEQEECKGHSIRGESERRTRINETNRHSISFNAQRKRKQQNSQKSNGLRDRENPDWRENWLEVATLLCRVDDGISRRMDRNPRLKALGNAIVPQVAEEIMRAIKFAS